jgi:hypothetical protein
LMMVDLEGPRETAPPQVSERLVRKREAGEGTAKAKERAGRARKTAEARMMVVDSAVDCKRMIKR